MFLGNGKFQQIAVYFSFTTAWNGEDFVQKMLKCYNSLGACLIPTVQPDTRPQAMGFCTNFEFIYTADKWFCYWNYTPQYVTLLYSVHILGGHALVVTHPPTNMNKAPTMPPTLFFCNESYVQQCAHNSIVPNSASANGGPHSSVCAQVTLCSDRPPIDTKTFRKCSCQVLTISHNPPQKSVPERRRKENNKLGLSCAKLRIS